MTMIDLTRAERQPLIGLSLQIQKFLELNAEQLNVDICDGPLPQFNQIVGQQIITYKYWLAAMAYLNPIIVADATFQRLMTQADDFIVNGSDIKHLINVLKSPESYRLNTEAFSDDIQTLVQRKDNLQPWVIAVENSTTNQLFQMLDLLNELEFIRLATKSDIEPKRFYELQIDCIKKLPIKQNSSHRVEAIFQEAELHLSMLRINRILNTFSGDKVDIFQEMEISDSKRLYSRVQALNNLRVNLEELNWDIAPGIKALEDQVGGHTPPSANNKKPAGAGLFFLKQEMAVREYEQAARKRELQKMREDLNWIKVKSEQMLSKINNHCVKAKQQYASLSHNSSRRNVRH